MTLALAVAAAGHTAGTMAAGDPASQKKTVEPAVTATEKAQTPKSDPMVGSKLDASVVPDSSEEPAQGDLAIDTATPAKGKALSVEIAPAAIAQEPAQLTGSNLLLALNAGGAQNVIVSPASVRSALEILLPGAPKDVQMQYGMPTTLRAMPGVVEANALWIDKSFDANESFVQVSVVI